MSNFNKVGIFMKTFGQEVKSKPSFSTDKINKLRIDLIKEELDELKEAMDNNDLLEVADALTDILYVTYGAGHAFGIDLDKCVDEVQNSNMSKLDENGQPIPQEAPAGGVSGFAQGLMMKAMTAKQGIQEKAGALPIGNVAAMGQGVMGQEGEAEGMRGQKWIRGQDIGEVNVL